MNFAECAFGNLLINEETPVLLVVGYIVLDACGDAGGLDSVDESTSELAGQEGVFAVCFEVASTKRVSRCADCKMSVLLYKQSVRKRTCRAKNHIYLLALGFRDDDIT